MSPWGIIIREDSRVVQIPEDFRKGPSYEIHRRESSESFMGLRSNHRSREVTVNFNGGFKELLYGSCHPRKGSIWSEWVRRQQGGVKKEISDLRPGNSRGRGIRTRLGILYWKKTSLLYSKLDWVWGQVNKGGSRQNRFGPAA